MIKNDLDAILKQMINTKNYLPLFNENFSFSKKQIKEFKKDYFGIPFEYKFTKYLTYKDGKLKNGIGKLESVAEIDYKNLPR
jgi:hypothetical protein